jgi:hypothetical protein
MGDVGNGDVRALLNEAFRDRLPQSVGGARHDEALGVESVHGLPKPPSC